MNFGLCAHSKGYDLSGSEVLKTLLCSIPYAERHWELSKVDPYHRYTHIILTVAHLLPLIGLFVAIAERIAVFVYNRFYVPSEVATLRSLDPWRPRHFSSDEALSKMWHSSKNLLDKCGKIQLGEPYRYPTVEEALPSLVTFREKAPEPASFSHKVETAQGGRPRMEDRNFYLETDPWILAGVFDGHSASIYDGGLVAQYVSEQIQKRFEHTFRQTNGNIYQTFEKLIYDIHYEVAAHDGWQKIGTTSSLCFIDKATLVAYTCTVGDSAIFNFRKFPDNSGVDDSEQLLPIPLTEASDWSNPKEAARAAAAMKKPEIATEWLDQDPKKLRCELYGDKDKHKDETTATPNMSRAIGDTYCNLFSGKYILTAKPTYKVTKLKFDDLLVLASDGLTDRIKPDAFSRYMTQDSQFYKETNTVPDDIPAKVIKDILNEYPENDNITVMFIHVNRSPDEEFIPVYFQPAIPSSTEPSTCQQMPSSEPELPLSIAL